MIEPPIPAMYQEPVEKTEYIAAGPKDCADFWAVLDCSARLQTKLDIPIALHTAPRTAPKKAAQHTPIFAPRPRSE